MGRREQVAGHQPAPGGLEGLNPEDPGVRLLGQWTAPLDPESVLLVHCGDLPGGGPGATRLILDVRERTESVHRCIADPARGDISEELAIGDQHFAAAALWPRAHLGKDFSEACLALACLGLHEGGRVGCAVRKAKGGKSLGRVMRQLLGDSAVSVAARDRGYHLWVGTRGPSFNAELAGELTTRRYEIRDPTLGELVLHSRPGVFSRKQLDAGTRALIHVAGAILEQDRSAGRRPRRILDLCAGVGPLGLWTASVDSEVEVDAVESNLRACALIRENARLNQLSPRVHVHESDGLPDELIGPYDFALLNPPTHADPQTLARLLDLRRVMAPGGRVLLVVNRPGRAVEALKQTGAEIEGGERDGYFVLQATWRTRTT